MKFKEGQVVLVRKSPDSCSPWTLGTVTLVDQLGPWPYLVLIGKHRFWRSEREIEAIPINATSDQIEALKSILSTPSSL